MESGARSQSRWSVVESGKWRESQEDVKRIGKEVRRILGWSMVELVREWGGENMILMLI